jgi:NADH-quinone oxidoreductase subunit C
MDFHAMHDRLRALRAPGLLGVDLPRPADPKNKKDPGRAGDPFVLIDPQRVADFLLVCRDEPTLAFEILADLTATDPAADGPELWVDYNLLSVTRRQRLALKALLPKAAPALPSATPVYRAAQWHERECAEMFGITFVGHPDPRNILLPDDWVGFPLRKDYVFPKEYHGISCE